MIISPRDLNCIMANLLDTYVLAADSDDGTLRFIHYYDAGNSWEPVELPASKLARNAWYKFKMEFSGTSCKVYVNDVLLQNYTDSSFSSGQIGLTAGTNYALGSVTIDFDDLKIWEIKK